MEEPRQPVLPQRFRLNGYRLRRAGLHHFADCRVMQPQRPANGRQGIAVVDVGFVDQTVALRFGQGWAPRHLQIQ
jgi:hypothetical protein